MRCAVFDFSAYRNKHDLNQGYPEVTDPHAGADVTNYQLTFTIRTHVSENAFAEKDKTVIRVFTSMKDYPLQAPGVHVRSRPVPWSPHVTRNGRVCIAPELWIPSGHVTLGELVIHLAQLLNWDEPGRGPDYRGFNPAAIAYHKKAYGGRPINPELRYPVLPGPPGPPAGPGDFSLEPKS
jgi:hypothetical protein